MKKITKRILAAVGCMLLHFSAYAYDFWEDGLYFNMVSTEDRTVEVTHNGKNTYESWVYVPATVQHAGHTFRVVGIGKKAFAGCRTVSEFDFDEGIEYIESEAFSSMSCPSSIVFPKSVKELHPNAFSNNSTLKTLTFRGEVSIGDYAFSNCTALTKITCEGGINHIGYNAFSNCSSLASFTISSAVTEIGENAFEGCKALKSLTNLAKKPQEVSEDMFAVFGTLHVQKGCASLYEAHAVWSRFKIVENAVDPTGIDDVKAASQRTDLPNLPVYVVSAGGKTRKVMGRRK